MAAHHSEVRTQARWLAEQTRGLRSDQVTVKLFDLLLDEMQMDNSRSGVEWGRWVASKSIRPESQKIVLALLVILFRATEKVRTTQCAGSYEFVKRILDDFFNSEEMQERAIIDMLVELRELLTRRMPL